jgi:hypothetical protein
MVDDETWNWNVNVFTDQEVLLDRLVAFWGRPTQIRQATDAIFRKTSVVLKEFRARGTTFWGLEGYIRLGNVFECRVMDDLARVVASDGIQEPAQGELEGVENDRHIEVRGRAMIKKDLNSLNSRPRHS